MNWNNGQRTNDILALAAALIGSEAWILMINGTLWNDSAVTFIAMFFCIRIMLKYRTRQLQGKRALLALAGAGIVTVLFVWGVQTGNITDGIVISHLLYKSILVLAGGWLLCYEIIGWYLVEGTGLKSGRDRIKMPVAGICLVVGLHAQSVIPVCSGASYFLFVLCIINHQINRRTCERPDRWQSLPALLLAICSTLGKWDKIAQWTGTSSFSVPFLLALAAGLVGWFFLWDTVLVVLMEKVWIHTGREQEEQNVSRGSFFMVMLGSFLCYVPYFLCYYPGILSTDSINQMRQVMGVTSYSNHHPFLHTCIIKLFYHIGYGLSQLWGSPDPINAGVAAYTLFSMAFMSFVFTCVWQRMVKWGIPGWGRILTFMFYAVFPINGVYAITMWKDIIFAGVVILFLLHLWDLWKEESKGDGSLAWKYRLRYVILSFGVCFLRGNGFFAWLLMLPFLLLAFKRVRKQMLLCTVVVLVMAAVYKVGVFSWADVSEPDFVESLSIPLQQVACVIAEDGLIEEEEERLIGQLADKEQIKTRYLRYISDPIKNLIREEGDQAYLTAHKREYLKAYIRIGMDNPFLYCKAFINQTKGYWFHKENNWIYYPSGVRENEIGIYQNSCLPEKISHVIKKVPETTERLYHKFFSIGLHTYILIFIVGTVGYDKYRRKNTDRNLILYFFPLTLLCTLLIATPVCAEFRYAYAVFASLPLLIGSMFRQ